MRRIFNAGFIAAFLIFASSCTHEGEPGGDIAGENDNAEVILRLKTPGGFSAPGSRGLTIDQENAIGSVHVLVFDKDDILTAVKQGEEVSYTVGSDDPAYSGTGSFAVTLESSRTALDTYNLVVLANAGAILSGTIGTDVSAIENKGYAAVTARIQAAVTGAMYPSGGSIPMWGESGPLVIAPGGANQSLTLTRSVARIDVGVGQVSRDGGASDFSWDGMDAAGDAIPFVLEEVYVIRPNDAYSLIPGASSLAAGLPTIPTGTAAFTVEQSVANFAFTPGGGFTSRDIYVPEADVLMDDEGVQGDANHANRMAIVVGGSYDGGGTTYYRLDFAQDGDLMNVLRNHLYQFNISGVSGAGYPDVETAYESLAVNMTVEIYEWDETNMGNIAFDGQYYLAVSQGSFQFTRDEINTEQDDNVLYVLTDYTTTASGGTSGWYVEKIVDAADDSQAVTWVTLTPGSGAANNKTKAILTVGVNNSTAERSAVIWIVAGRLRYPVTVTQSLTPALGIQVLDGSNAAVTELVFASAANVAPGPQTLTVKWVPKDAALTVSSVAVGSNAFSATGAPESGTVSGGTGTVGYTIQPAAFTPGELDEAQGGNPFLEKVSKVEFMTTNGISYAAGSVFLRQINYNLLTDVAAGYMLNAQTETVNVRANFGWTITAVTDNDDILQDENALVGMTGGNNTSAGNAIQFTMQAEDTQTPKSGKTATITLTSQRDGSTYDIVITAIEALYVGYFGGALIDKGSGVWQFERALYVQNEDENAGVTWSTNTSSMQGGTYDTNGKTSTYNLHTNSYSNPAATLCYNKNTGTIAGASDLVWYLPAQKQLMAIWTVHASYESTYQFSSAYYWSATEYNATNAWYVNFGNGYTYGNGKTTTNRVRCVREL